MLNRLKYDPARTLTIEPAGQTGGVWVRQFTLSIIVRRVLVADIDPLPTVPSELPTPTSIVAVVQIGEADPDCDKAAVEVLVAMLIRPYLGCPGAGGNAVTGG